MYPLEQGCNVQGTVSFPVPEHGFPPFFGAGLEQVRERVILAVPQVAEQEDQDPQADHDPSTAIRPEYFY